MIQDIHVHKNKTHTISGKACNEDCDDFLGYIPDDENEEPQIYEDQEIEIDGYKTLHNVITHLADSNEMILTRLCCILCDRYKNTDKIALRPIYTNLVELENILPNFIATNNKMGIVFHCQNMQACLDILFEFTKKGFGYCIGFGAMTLEIMNTIDDKRILYYVFDAESG